MLTCVLVNNLLCYSSVGLVNASPIGFQSQMFWGHVPWAAAAKAGVPDMWISSFQRVAGDPIYCWTKPEREDNGNAHQPFWDPGRISASS